MGCGKFFNIAPIVIVFALFSGAAHAEPSCTLTANPQRIHMNETATLTLKANGDVYAGYIDQQLVNLPQGTVTLTPASQGVFTARGMILSRTIGEFYCSATYEVIAAREATLVGDVVSATTGLALSGVSISLIPGTAVTTSDSSGAFSFNTVSLGGYTLTASLAGYTTETFSGVAVSGTNTPIHFVLNPILPSGQLRVVLTWGENPLDLDTHLFTRWATGDTFHLFYRALTGLNTILDVDDTSSYGPETATILDSTPGRYTYAVYDYTNGNSDKPGEISTSAAVVKVYQGNNLIEEYRPTNTGTQTSWHVFDADILANGTVRITPVNRYSDVNLNDVGTFP